jgi:hypothetical protein
MLPANPGFPVVGNKVLVCYGLEAGLGYPSWY